MSAPSPAGDAGGLDIALAHRLASLAVQAYWHDSFEPWALSQGYTEPERFHEASIQAKLMRDGERLLLVFAGTDLFNLREWFGYDFDIRRDPMPGLDPAAWVHRGFRRALHSRSKRSERSLFDRIVESVAARLVRHGPLPVHVGGHSLGAAMSKLFAAELAESATRGAALPLLPDHIAGVLTFGEPRCGNVPFAAAMDRLYGPRLQRGAFGRDWVPHAPPRTLGFRHSGVPHWIDREGTIHLGTDRVFRRTSSADHLPQRYARAYANYLSLEKGQVRGPITRGLAQTLRDVYEIALHPGRHIVRD